MATSNEKIEIIASNVTKIAKEISILLEKGIQAYPSSQEVNYSTIASSIQTNFDKTFDYTRYLKRKLYGSETNGLSVLYLYGDVSAMTKENKVDLSYKYGSPIDGYAEGTCTCKWQGASSLNFPRKNYTIAKLSPQLDLGWGNQKKYVLKSSYNEYSMALNVCNAKLWGQVVNSRKGTDSITTRLKSCPNGGAIDGFPIILVVNDSYQGVYDFNIPKDNWMFGMGGSETEGFLCTEGGNDAEMKLALQLKGPINKEKLLQEIGFSIGYVPNEDEIDWIVNGANQAINAVVNSTGVNYRSTLDNYIDVQSFLDYMIFLMLFNMGDGLYRNWLLCTYDGVKFFCSAYDLDSTFGGNHIGNAFASPEISFVNTVVNGVRINHLLYTYDKAFVKARYEELRNSVYSETNVFNVYQNFLTQIPHNLRIADSFIWPGMPNTNQEPLARIMNWYQLHCDFIDQEVESWNV